MRDLSRLLQPQSIAVIGGGTWCANVIEQCRKFGFTGDIWPVHPTREEFAGIKAFAKLTELPRAPDAAFVGVNRNATIDVVRSLSETHAGGAVCFASGFSEAAAEDDTSNDLQAALVQAAGNMPILGPNCYGFVNALDTAVIWPDQHGCIPVDRGVAILTQSSNIAINLTMQQRALPIAYAITCGNMAQTSQAQIARALLDDDRVTAIGLHVEGFGNIPEWETLARDAHARGVPLVVLKAGVSEQARAATVSHTASLAGSDAGAQALLDRLGIARVTTPAILLETLQLLHCNGPLAGNWLASISCSGGEASLVADLATTRDLTFPPLTPEQKTGLRAALGPMVALSNPLDYHTYIWGDVARMTQAWSAICALGIDLTLSVVDYPTTDRSAWRCTVDAALAVRAQTGRPFAIVASLSELMPPDIAAELMAGGVTPLHGLDEALAAAEAAARIRPPHALPVAPAPAIDDTRTLTEAEAKARIASHGVIVPWSCRYEVRADGIAPISDPRTEHTGDCFYSDTYAIKGEGMAHKSEAGAVRLNVAQEDWESTARDIGTQIVLVECMVTGGVAELLIGITRDPAHGFALTIGAGGIWTELLRDTATRLLPVTEGDIHDALKSLRIYPLLTGFRGNPPANLYEIETAILALQDYVLNGPDAVAEVEINPLICTPDRAVAADALITLEDKT
ncbi:acetate--CoA ligase family protein [Marimonas sp. MJW-29]|uniref:Acetate--CoA ligase family protein n=1 Tax=Sulfitobacter sediminis TaxID=3234186 RepID=A0ABV3RH43_9RHOB